MIFLKYLKSVNSAVNITVEVKENKSITVIQI